MPGNPTPHSLLGASSGHALGETQTLLGSWPGCGALFQGAGFSLGVTHTFWPGLQGGWVKGCSSPGMTF